MPVRSSAGTTLFPRTALRRGASRNGGWLIKTAIPLFRTDIRIFIFHMTIQAHIHMPFSYSLREKYDRNYCYDGAINDFPLRNDRVVANVYRAAGSEAEGKTEVLKAVKYRNQRKLLYS